MAATRLYRHMLWASHDLEGDVALCEGVLGCIDCGSPTSVELPLDPITPIIERLPRLQVNICHSGKLRDYRKLFDNVAKGFECRKDRKTVRTIGVARSDDVRVRFSIKKYIMNINNACAGSETIPRRPAIASESKDTQRWCRNKLIFVTEATFYYLRIMGCRHAGLQGAWFMSSC